MKCTNCGNDNPATLWDEGDTIYCSVCTHRTRKTDFEDDSVQCPYCHRLRDKKAMYCRYCNSSDWTPSSPAEFAEIDIKGHGLLEIETLSPVARVLP